MKDESLLRYSRQIMLPELDVAGQQRLIDARVLIVGAGGLGCPAAMYLAAAGIGHLTLADHDTVELSNLQRQIAHSQARLGQLKVESARQTLAQLNPEVEVAVIAERLEGEALATAVAAADVVVDASDNFRTRFAINEACLQHEKPLVSGAAIRMEGQVAVFDARDPASPCYRCLYGGGEDEDLNCATNGVIAPLVGIIGTVQAMEVLKLVAGFGLPLTGRLMLLDAATMQWREMRLPRDPKCPACADRKAAAD